MGETPTILVRCPNYHRQITLGPTKLDIIKETGKGVITCWECNQWFRVRDDGDGLYAVQQKCNPNAWKTQVIIETYYKLRRIYYE